MYADDLNLDRPDLGHQFPAYPHLRQMVRVAGQGGPVYTAFVQQWDGLLPRDREPCYVWEANGIIPGPGIYRSRLVGNYNGLPLYFIGLLCCVAPGSLSSSSSSAGSLPSQPSAPSSPTVSPASSPSLVVSSAASSAAPSSQVSIPSSSAAPSSSLSSASSSSSVSSSSSSSSPSSSSPPSSSSVETPLWYCLEPAFWYCLEAPTKA